MGPQHWQKLSSTVERDHRVFQLRRDVAVSPRTGEELEFIVLETGDWASVVAFEGEEGKLVGIRQYRHGSGEVGLEIPGGLVEPGMTPEEAAREELRQETGFGGGRWTKLGELRAVPALFTNRLHVFLAEGVEVVGEQELEAGEDIQVELIHPDTLRGLIRAGDLVHAQVVAALYLYELHLDGAAVSDAGVSSSAEPPAKPAPGSEVRE